jgi:hypothetical protein
MHLLATEILVMIKWKILLGPLLEPIVLGTSDFENEDIMKVYQTPQMALSMFVSVSILGLLIFN